MDHSKQVKSFFEKAASRYRENNQSASSRYFSQRLQLALSLASLSSSVDILDIGCGSGVLFDALKKDELHRHYLGIDFSEQMLKRSNIPNHQRQVIDLQSFNATATKQFDTIFALGFTSYLTPADLNAFLHILYERLKDNGQAIISYTHADSYDYRFRNWLNRNFRKWFPSNTSLGRDFQIQASTPDQVIQSLPSGLVVLNVSWLPFSFPVLNSLPKKLHQYIIHSANHNRWQGDFLLLLQKDQNADATDVADKASCFDPPRDGAAPLVNSSK